MRTLLADPLDPALDSFNSTNREVDEFFQSRAWFRNGKASPETYRFEDGPYSRVGYASAAFRKLPHPNETAQAKALYLVVYALGVDKAWQGDLNPITGTTYAMCVVDELAAQASTDTRCVGLSLWVRTDNPRAIAFYTKCGFVEDPAGPVHRDKGAPHQTMRLIW